MPVSAEGRVQHQKLEVFGVQFDSLEKSVLANDEKCGDFIPTYVAT